MGSILDLGKKSPRRGTRHTPKRGTKADARFAVYLLLGLIVAYIFYTHSYTLLILPVFFILLILLFKWLIHHYRYKGVSTDEQYILRLPKYGHGLRGMTTSEFANACGLDLNNARYILNKYKARRRITCKMSGSKWRWYLREDN